MSRKKSNLKLNRKKISRLDRKQNTILRTIHNHHTGCNSLNVKERPHCQTLIKISPQKCASRSKLLPSKRNTPRGKCSPFFSPSKKKLRYSSPSPGKFSSAKASTTRRGNGYENIQNLNFGDHNYHLLYRKALSRKALFVTPFQTLCGSQRDQDGEGFTVLSDIEDTDENSYDCFSAWQVNDSAEEQEETQCQYDTTHLKIISSRPDTTENKQNSSIYSDHTYQAKYERSDQQDSQRAEQYNKLFYDLSNYEAENVTYQAHVNILPDHDRSDANTEDFELLSEINAILPTVIQELRNSGINPSFLTQFFGQVSSKIFPLHNIAFLLWLEVVQWYSKDTSTCMRYSEETKKFWKLGWRHFGGKFVRFMGGFKNMSQINTGESQPGMYNPMLSDINFVVPDTKTLQTFSPYGQAFGQMMPGIFNEIISDIAVALDNRSVCLSFDGKKLKQGLTDNFGDVDLLGFEEVESLTEKRQKHEQLTESVINVIRVLEELNPADDIKDISPDLRHYIVFFLRTLLPDIGRSAQDIRRLKAKKEYGKDKFLEQSGSDWRQSKFAYVISAIKACLYDIEEFEKCYREVLEKICCFCSYVNDSENEFCKADAVHLPGQQNYRELAESGISLDTRKIKQRSEMWHEIRNTAIVTGSTLYKATGLDGLKNQRDHFESVCCGSKQKQVSESVQKAMDYGTKNEINGIATLVGKVLPVIEPKLTYNEEGCVRFGLPNSNKYVVVSPDGSLSNQNTECTVSAVEIKCPTKQLHTEVPERYLLQCQATMHALGVDTMYYLCWRPDFSSVFEVKSKPSIFDEAISVVNDTLGPDRPKRPSALHKNVRKLKSCIKDECKNINFIGEFVSGYSSSTPSDRIQGPMTVSNAIDMHKKIVSLLREGYQLKREKATEAVVFICCDLDREWSKNPLRWAPISWFPKGYSLKTDTMRKIYEKVMEECNSRGLHVPAVSFDGQWHNIAVRSLQNKPLTLLQLQKDVWRESEKMQKSEIVRTFENLNKSVQCTVDTGDETYNRFVCFGNETRLPQTPTNGWKLQRTAKAQEMKSTDDRTDRPVLEVVPEAVAEAVVALATGSEVTDAAEILPHVSIEASLSNEIATCNSDEELWLRILLEETKAFTDTREDLEVNCNQETIYTNEEFKVEDDHNYNVSNVSQRLEASQDFQCPSQDKTISANSEPGLLSTGVATVLLSFLKTDTKANKKGGWDSKTPLDVVHKLSSYDELKLLLNDDLIVIIRFLKKTDPELKAKESDTKTKKLDFLCHYLRLERKSDPKKTKNVRRTPKCLREIAKSVLMSKVPKSVLNIAYAEYIWPERFMEWEQEATISNAVKIEDTVEPEFWFSHPEFSESRNQLEVKCVDSTHLFTRLRRHSCKGCLDGINCTAWKNVAKQRTTLLTPVMVDDLTDPMSAAMARTHFSELVEKAMRKNGEDAAANLCHDIRLWWSAEDDAGIPALERMTMRLNLRSRLLDGVQFGKFPPPTSYVKGFPIQLWEALVSNIDSKSQLYALCRQGTFNTRAFSSMMGETFFAELTLQDSHGHGAVSCEDFSLFMGKMIEQMQTRLDTSRRFAYRTSKKTVYDLVNNDVNETYQQEQTTSESNDNSGSLAITKLKLRDHFFDTDGRKRFNKKKKFSTISTDRNSIQKGTLGVRWERARINESKMLQTDKIGLPKGEYEAC